MGVLTPKRVVLFVVAVLICSNGFANHPSPRTQARMAFDAANKVSVLFGGRGAFDEGGTGLTHSTSETWLFNGTIWLKRFPTTIPPDRSSHSMVYDSAHGRVLMFGGSRETTVRDGDAVLLNDTWAWKDENWSLINTATKPSPRQLSGMAYDPDRDRTVLFGGLVYAADGRTLEPVFDTWEFDGTDWTRVGSNPPSVTNPLLAYDAANDEIIMMGTTGAAVERVMYRYDAEAHSWTKIEPAALPACIANGHLLYQEHRGRLMFAGGLCPTGTPTVEDIYEWDGSTWNEITVTEFVRITGQAVAYDSARDRVVSFGGTAAQSPAPNASTILWQNGTIFSVFVSARPHPRSLAGFASDPVSKTVWMFGGLDEISASFYGDFWGYRAGQWFQAAVEGGPGAGCETPLAAYDTDRARLVVTCAGTHTFEWDGTVWKSFANLNPQPSQRLWSGMAYDPKLKKTVLYGGYFDRNFRNDTWTWNGTAWTEVKMDRDERPDNRGLHAMWYDPLQQKVVLYGGFGRPNIDADVERFSDMWAFNGTGWTEIEVPTPGERFGPQVAVNPNTGKALLFGGLRADHPDEDTSRQFFDNDTWEWDGTAMKWTRLEPQRSPEARENGSMAWDPAAGEIVLFGGYANGFYHSDVWVWNGETWIPRPDFGGRRRAVR